MQVGEARSDIAWRHAVSKRIRIMFFATAGFLLLFCFPNGFGQLTAAVRGAVACFLLSAVIVVLVKDPRKKKTESDLWELPDSKAQP
jgi:hypothetical protein